MEKDQKVENIVRHSWHIALILVVGLVVGSILLGMAVQKSIYIERFDDYFYGVINGMPRIWTIDVLVKPVNENFLRYGWATLPSFLYLYVGLFLAYMLMFKRKLFGWTILTIVVGTIFVGLLFALNSHFIFRERPYVRLPSHYLDEPIKRQLTSWTSFPSGHSRETAMYSTIIAAYIPVLTIPVIIFTLFVAFSRVYVGVHYPTDALSGVLIGFLSAKLALIISREVQLVFENRQKYKESLVKFFKRKPR